MRQPFYILACCLALHSTGMAASIITGYEISGTTTSITLTAGNITDNPNNNTSLSNSSGNLVVNFSDPNPGSTVSGDNDFYLTWVGATDGLNFSTATYNYVQVDILSTSAGMGSGNWQIFFQDDDSTIGGGSNSGQNIGSVSAIGGAGFSVVIDLTDGGTNTSGAAGWGPGTLDQFRLDLFNDISSFGESVTISAVTFGSAITPIPEPATWLLTLLGLTPLLRRRR